MPMLAYAVTIFLSAFLLFQIQPLISRYILPWFGGSSAVWSAAMLFFQVLLLGGYGYAHWIAGRGRGGSRGHLLLLLVSIAVILVGALLWGSPLLPDSAWKPPDSSAPLLRIILVLLVSVGLPYFVLASTSPLLQAWWENTFPGQRPYRLYALSNFGSLLALASYPFVFEPLLSLREQSGLWSAGFLLFTGLCGLLAYRMSRRVRPAPAEAVQIDDEEVNEEDVENEVPQTAGEESQAGRQWMWVGLAACASILLLAITSQLSQEVAVIPFLWVLPLSLYLLSFVVAFSGAAWYRREVYLTALGLATALVAYTLYQIESVGILPQILIYSLFLFLACLVCHAELYRLRPDGKRLTSFYFLVSLGGAIGGLFVNLAAPLIFKGYWEMQVGILFCWLLVFVLLWGDRSSIFHRKAGWISTAAFLVLFSLLGYMLYQKISATENTALAMNRNFYGVFRVRSISVGTPGREAISLTHGITSHGYQLVEDRMEPTSYYTSQSGIALAIRNTREVLRRRHGETGVRMGVVGLGIGTLAVYGEPQDTIRFYEINPDIISLAQGEGNFFTYLQETPAEVEIVPGDARLALELELEQGEPGDFHILAVDAFSGDSIPVHLLTAEAFDLYLKHLAPGGVLALHISNRYLDLTPVVHRAAGMHNLGQALIYGPRDDQGSYLSKWVLLSTDRSFLSRPEIASVNLGLSSREGFRPWTDDYSNLFQVLQFSDPLLALPAPVFSR